MIRVNLLPLKEAEAAIGRRQQMSLAALGMSVAVLIMIVPFLIQGRQLAALERDIERVQEELTRFNAQVKEVHDLEKVKGELETKLKIIRDLNQKRQGPARVLSDLSTATPDNLWLVDFNEGNSEATLTGMALDNETIARFMRQLQASPYFVGVDLVETSRQAAQRSGANEKSMDFTRFIVKAAVNYFGRGNEQPGPGEPPTNGAGGRPAK